MARSIKKGPYVASHLEKKVVAINEGKNKKSVIKTWSRRSTIISWENLPQPASSKDTQVRKLTKIIVAGPPSLYRRTNQ